MRSGASWSGFCSVWICLCLIFLSTRVSWGMLQVDQEWHSVMMMRHWVRATAEANRLCVQVRSSLPIRPASFHSCAAWGCYQWSPCHLKHHRYGCRLQVNVAEVKWFQWVSLPGDASEIQLH